MKIILLSISVVFNLLIFAQASFVSPDTVCVNQTFNVTNLSTGMNVDYSWNFTKPNVNNTGTGVNTGNPTGLLNANVFCDMVEDAGSYYMFVTNYSARTVVRLDYGNSPLNVPVGTNLGSFGGLIPPQTEGIQIRKEGANWFGFVVGGSGVSTARIVRLEFGTSLTNVPTVIDLGNIGGMDWPIEYQLLKDGTNWYGIVANRSNSRIVVHNFGNSLTNVPTGSSHAVTSASGTCNLMAVKEAGNWHVFTTAMFGGQSLVRLDYGNSLTNIPTEVNLGNFGGNITSLPRAILILKDCDQFVGYLGHEGGTTLKLNFPSGVAGPITVTNLGNINGVYGKVHQFTPVTHNGNLYLFTCDYQSNTLTRMDISLATGGLFPSSDNVSLPPISIPTIGNYDITLLVDLGRGSQDAYCKDIDVLTSVPYDVGNDTAVCKSIGYVVLDAGAGYTPYNWNTGQTTRQISVNTPGKYYVNAVDPTIGCPVVDTINVSFIDVPVDIGPDLAQCNGVSKPVLDGGGFTSYVWNTGETTQTISAQNAGWYWVDVTDNKNCVGRDSLYLTLYPLPSIYIVEDTLVDCGAEFYLNKHGNPTFNYQWQNGSTSTEFLVEEKGTYNVLVSNTYNCSSFFTSKVRFKNCEIFLPNAFTPDQDGKNDVIKPTYFSKPDSYHLRIFNKWGEVIYQTDNIDDFWDGKYKSNEVKPDIYIYRMEYRFPNEKLQEVIGQISLLQ